MTATDVDALDALAPIGLDELVERAELLTRVDRKYVVTLDQARALVTRVPRDTQVLEIDRRRSFGYRSAYLDTAALDSYLGAGRSHRRRWKVRTRTYLDTGSTWLEVKTRTGRDQTVKQRIEHPDAEQIGGLTAEGQAFAAAIIGPAYADALRPVLATAYQRSTLLLPGHHGETDSRVTIDVDLGWSALDRIRDLDRPATAIVETKTGSTPSNVDRLLWSHGHRPLRISKYGVGMAALDPTLPRLKWHHTLDRHLGLARAA